MVSVNKNVNHITFVQGIDWLLFT